MLEGSHGSFGQYYTEFPVTEQIDFFAIISKFPQLNKDDIEFIMKIIYEV